MSLLVIDPHAGINRRFPENRLTGKSKNKDIQKVQALNNALSLDGRIGIVGGASRYDNTAKVGNGQWAKRIYYQDGMDDKKFLFVVIGGRIYKGDDATSTLTQVSINNSLDIQMSTTFYPIHTTVKVGGNVCVYMVDGKYFYRFTGNASGNWDRLPIPNDLDGNPIAPVFVAEWLDRLCVLTQKNNILLMSNNLNPDVFDDPADSILLETPPGNGGYPVALKKYRGVLHIFHNDYFVPVTGSSPSTFGIRPGDLAEGYGTEAPRSVILVKDLGIGFLNSKDNEFYTTLGTLDSTKSTPLSYEINLSTLIDPVKSQDTVCHLDTALNCIRIAYFASGGTTLGDEEIYSLTEEKWCGQTRGRNVSCYSQWDGLGDDNRLLTGRSDSGLIMVNNASLNFDDAAIHMKIILASYAPEDPFDCQFETIFVEGKSQTSQTVSFNYYLDSRITTRGEEQVPLQGEIFNVGLIEIAEQTIMINRFIPLIDRSKARMIRFEIESNVVNTVFEFYQIYCFYNKQNEYFSKTMGGQ